MFSVLRRRIPLSPSIIRLHDNQTRSFWNWKIGWIFKEPSHLLSSEEGYQYMKKGLPLVLGVGVIGHSYLYYIGESPIFNYQEVENKKWRHEEELLQLASDRLLVDIEKANKPLEPINLPQWPPPFPIEKK